MTVISEKARSDAKRINTPEKKLRKILNGVAFDEFNDFESENKIQADYILSIGRIVPHKDFETIIEAISNMNTDINLKIVGRVEDESYVEDLEELCATLGVEDEVSFEGFVSRKRKKELLCGAKCYVSSSKHEGFGLTLLEAMASAIPVIASDIEAHREVLQSSDLIFDPEDAEELSILIDQVLSGYSDSQVRKLVSRARNLSWKNQAQSYEEVYEEL
jgi:glycosyltransferase involved in cell wall biosynthesis